MLPQRLLRTVSSQCSKLVKYSQAAPSLDPVQEALLAEPCILVDKDDRVVGQASKRECHLMKEGTSPLHRAFSLFVFNNAGELLLQQRSSTKITFPDMWTNTCCSHPLAVEGEMEEEGAWGVRRAAQRRIGVELGVGEGEVRAEDIMYLTRILYQAPSSGMWGEHELDYILMMRGDPVVRPNTEEVKDIAWVRRTDLPDFLADLDSRGVEVTPWFKLISRSLLPTWWADLENVGQYRELDKIHKF